MLKKKTDNGTISATSFETMNEKGIAVGLYGEMSVVSFESNGKGLILLINDDMIEQFRVNVLHTDANWNAK